MMPFVTRPLLLPVLLLLAVALLASNCTLGRGTRTSSIAPREQPNPSMLNADVEALRRENSQLQAQQELLQNRINDMESKLGEARAEQRRFQESITTSFDLLEQSVALTLSKTITADIGAAASQEPPRTQSATIGSTNSRGGTAGAVSHAAAPAANMSANTARHTDSMAAAPTPTPAEVRATPVAMRNEEPEAIHDADLLPPDAPRQLTAHQAAKPLYEKGFALFARKDYDQAVIVFQNFLQRYPNDIYSDNAQFWIAEALTNMNRTREAEDAYRAVLRNYEHRSTLEGYKTPDAIYRLGQAYQRRGDVRRARYYFEVTGERFPDTSAGRKALGELATLGINTAQR